METETLATQDGEELARLLNELTMVAANRTLDNEVQLHYHVGASGITGWRAGVSGFAGGVVTTSERSRGHLVVALRELVAALRREAEEADHMKQITKRRPAKRRRK